MEEGVAGLPASAVSASLSRTATGVQAPTEIAAWVMTPFSISNLVATIAIEIIKYFLAPSFRKWEDPWHEA